MKNFNILFTGLKYIKNSNSFNGIELFDHKFLGFSCRESCKALYLYLFTFCIHIDFSDDREYFIYSYGRDRKVLSRIYPWYTGYNGLYLNGKKFIGLDISRERPVKLITKTRIIANTRYSLHLYFLFYLITLQHEK